jgi:hypothetical protein
MRAHLVSGESDVKTLSRLVNTTYFVLLGGRAALYLIGGLFLLVVAGCLGFAWIDGWLVVIPIFIGAKGCLLVMQALEPFAGKRPQPAQPKSFAPPRSNNTDPRRRHPARESF